MSIDLILDGLGDGNLAGVNSDKQLLTRSIIIPALTEASLLGNAYSWTSITTNLGPGGTGLCLVNDSSSKWLVVSSAYVWSDVASQVKLHLPAAATWSGTDVVGVNLNTNYASSSPASGYANETGNTFVDANTITTVYSPVLTNGQITTNLGVHIDFKDSVILGNNEALAADWITDSGAFECTFVGYFIDVPE